jgi:tetratricopeptide (TPR) repeat protein
MKGFAPAPADLQRWSEDVARDPASLSFLPLARAYRKQGRRDIALKLCLRGLEQHPTFVEGHALLAMIYFETGQRAKAYDEWSMVQQLEPTNFEALRGMGFFHLEKGDDPSALRSLQRAAALRPDDPTVKEALKLVHERNRTAAPSTHLLDRDPWEETPTRAPESSAERFAPPPRTHSEPTLAPAAPPPAPPKRAVPDLRMRAAQPAPRPTEIASFEQSRPAPLSADRRDCSIRSLPTARSSERCFWTQGLVLAGTLAGESGRKAEELGAILGGALEEATRTVAHLELGSWRGILLESEHALIQVLPVRADMVVLVAAKRETPTGWMTRSAGQAAQLARRFLEAYG